MVEFEQIENNKYLLDIKSFHNLNEIFSFLTQRKKLNLIIYNKQLQKMFGVNIQDYKQLSGKYKIIGKNGKVKEFIINTDKLIFEGEYLNGKRNGIGKEFYGDGKLKYEGEYLNGKRWNGKGYNKNGIMEFQLKDGKGEGKEYNNNDELEFEGEYINGERSGKGKEYDCLGELIYEGEYLNGKRNGKGEEYDYLGKLEFVGEYLNGKRWNGKGYDKNGKLDFQIKGGQRNN